MINYDFEQIRMLLLSLTNTENIDLAVSTYYNLYIATRDNAKLSRA